MFKFGKLCVYSNNSAPSYDSCFYICLAKQMHANKEKHTPLFSVMLFVALSKYEKLKAVHQAERVWVSPETSCTNRELDSAVALKLFPALHFNDALLMHRSKLTML